MLPGKYLNEITTMGLANPIEYGALYTGDDTSAFKKLHEAINSGEIPGYFLPKTAKINTGNLPVLTKDHRIAFTANTFLDFSENFTASRGISVEGSLGAAAELTGTASAGTYILEVGTGYADNTLLKLIDKFTIWDPAGTATHPGEFVEAKQPDGWLAGVNGAVSGGITATTKVKSMSILNLNPRWAKGNATGRIWPATGSLEVGEETYVYTALAYEGNVVKFTITEREATKTTEQGNKATLAKEAGKVYLTTPVQYEYGYTVANVSTVEPVTPIRSVLQDVRIKGPEFLPHSGETGTGIVGIAIYLGARCHIDTPYLQNCLTTGIRLESCIWSEVTDYTVINSRQLNFSTAGGSAYGLNFARGTQESYVRGGHTRGTRHAFTVGAGGDMLVRNCTIEDVNAVATFADAFDSHGAADGLNFIRCTSIEANGAGFNINSPKCKITDCTAVRPFTAGVVCANQSIGTTIYQVDVAVLEPSGGTFQSTGAGVSVSSAVGMSVPAPLGVTAAEGAENLEIAEAKAKGFKVGLPVQFTALTAGVTSFKTGVLYWPTEVTEVLIKLSATKGGTVIKANKPMVAATTKAGVASAVFSPVAVEAAEGVEKLTLTEAKKKGLVVGAPVCFASLTAAVTGLETNTAYWVVESDETGFKISATKGGTAIKPAGHAIEAASTKLGFNIGPEVRQVRIRANIDSPQANGVIVSGIPLQWSMKNVHVDLQSTHGPELNVVDLQIKDAEAVGVNITATNVTKNDTILELVRLTGYSIREETLQWAEAGTGIGLIATECTEGVIYEGPQINRGGNSTELDNSTTKTFIYPGPNEKIVKGTGAGNKIAKLE